MQYYYAEYIDQDYGIQEKVHRAENDHQAIEYYLDNYRGRILCIYRGVDSEESSFVTIYERE